MCNDADILLFLSVESDYSYYNLILKKAGQFLDNLHINLLKFAFSVRAYSPTIQMFQQVCKNHRGMLPYIESCWLFKMSYKPVILL
jgi:hypothetical protein